MGWKEVDLFEDGIGVYEFEKGNSEATMLLR